jgi:hypothetical protein
MSIGCGVDPLWAWVPRLFIHGAAAVSPVGNMKWICGLFVVIVIAAIIGIDPLYKSAPSERDSTDE